MIEVVGTDEFAEWYRNLEDGDADAVTRSVETLRVVGVVLGFPQSSAIKGTKRHALRELRVQSKGSAIRVLYVFDPQRQAVLLIGGIKSDEVRFYEKLVEKAEKIFDVYLAEQAAGLHDKEE